MTTPKIACLGWGSLCWRPEKLKTIGAWRSDGPMLPLEFTRASDAGKGRLTLVLTPGAPSVPTLWTLLDYSQIEDAREALRDREGCVMRDVGLWPGADGLNHFGGAVIAAWAEEHRLDHVLWTALGPKFGNVSGRQPSSADEALEYLRSRPPEVLKKAEEYVRKAPAQIRTPFRTAFEAQLGWTPIVDSD